MSEILLTKKIFYFCFIISCNNKKPLNIALLLISKKYLSSYLQFGRFIQFPSVDSSHFLWFWDHPFSTYAKFSEKLRFLPPDTYTNVCVSGGKKSQFFGNFRVRTRWMIPFVIHNIFAIPFLVITNVFIKTCAYTIQNLPISDISPEVWTQMPNFLEPDSRQSLIISLYFGSNICNGHCTYGNTTEHKKIGISTSSSVPTLQVKNNK